MKTCLSNSNGSIILSTLFLSFATAMFLGLGAVGLSRVQLSKSLHECRLAALDAQEFLAKALSELFRLNKRAEFLEYENRRWRHKLAVAPTPESKALAAAGLARIVTQQLQLKSQQLLIVSTGRTQALARLGKWQQSTIRTPRLSKLKLAILPYMSSIAPPYKTKPQFSLEQAISLSVLTSSHQQDWIKCGATIEHDEKEQTRWIVRLSADRSLLNRL